MSDRELNHRLAHLLIAARHAKGLTQKQAAELAGLSQGRVSELESAKGNPRFGTLDKLSRALGMMLTIRRSMFPAGWHEIFYRTASATANGTLNICFGEGLSAHDE